VSPLPKIPILSVDQEVGINASTLLDNGQLVLVGSERHKVLSNYDGKEIF